MPAQFDVITIFDVVHDAVDPLQLLPLIRPSSSAGWRLRLSRHRLLGPTRRQRESAWRDVSWRKRVLLHDHVVGEQWRRIGHAWFHEAKVRELCEKAGFSSVRRVPLEILSIICTKQNRKIDYYTVRETDSSRL